MSATWTMLTPTTAAGAVGAVRIAAASAQELDAVMRACGLVSAPHGSLAVGKVVLCDLLSVDHGLVVRWNDSTVDLFPHAGPLVQHRLLESLVARGVPERHAHADDWRSRQPAARDELEALMLDTIARAASPRALDLLLAAPAAWHERGHETWRQATATSRDRRLRRLIDPPLVVLLGPANIGKSTLINTLACRAVSIVDAQPGSTRDHVGVLLQLDGLVARVVDTPGMRVTDDPIEAEAQRAAMSLAAAADLLVVCGDALSPPPGPAQLSGIPAVRVALRTDLGEPQWPADALVCAAQGRGIDALAVRIRNALVPDADLASAEPWRFW